MKTSLKSPQGRDSALQQTRAARKTNGSEPSHRARYAAEVQATIVTGTDRAKPEPDRSPRWKRVLDLTCILLTLPFWLLLMILITLWIKVVSPGPVFFRQVRVGYKGRRFNCLKFRSMKVNVETQIHEGHFERLMQADCPMTKLDAFGDPRLIRGGCLIRALGLDELPQIFNVLHGEMSLVGPRPCTPHEFHNYESWQKERVNALPGLTGYWQVNGKNKKTFSEMIDMDIFYANNLSILLDLRIIVKTIPAILVQTIESRMVDRPEIAADKPLVEQHQQ